jgi:hypothetical protein
MSQGRPTRWRATAAVGPVVLLLLAACASPPAGRASAASPAASAATAPPGGCAGTRVVSGPAPPPWARAGFSPDGPSPVPWALGTPGDALVYLFAVQLVAGGSRPDGSSNKLLWATRDPTDAMLVEGRPLGREQPVVTVRDQLAFANQMPSTVDVPSAGCWSFRVTWGQPSRTSTIDLDVLPAGALPPRTEAPAK